MVFNDGAREMQRLGALAMKPGIVVDRRQIDSVVGHIRDLAEPGRDLTDRVYHSLPR